MRLVRASMEPPAGLLDFIREIGEGENGFGGEPSVISGPLSELSAVEADFELAAFLQSLVEMSEGRNLPDGWVPMTTFWFLDDDGPVRGMSRLRHQLTPFLLEHGGHIGYYVARAHRGKGYATQMLAATLLEANALGIERALLTVDSDNGPSIRVIERNGGVMEDEGIDGATGKLHRRYWIELVP